MWWVLFNKPSECLHGADGALCGMKDVMTNANNVDNPAWISIVHAAGGKSEYWGDLTLTSTIYKTKQSLNLADPEGGYVWGGPPAFNNPETRGYFPATNEETEVHLVFRDHGPPSFSYLEQITTFTDPDCAERGGPNLCLDIGHVAFPNPIGKITKYIGHFPKFPPGCAATKECSAEEEAIQLSYDNQVYIIRTGDAVQVVAQIYLPRIVCNTTLCYSYD